MQQVQSNLVNAETRSEFNSLLESTLPPSNGSTAVYSQMIAGKTNRLIHDRLSTSRTSFSSVDEVSATKQKSAKVARLRDRSQANNNDSSILVTSIEPAAGGKLTGSSDVIPNKTRQLIERRKRYLQARNRNADNEAYRYEEVKSYKDEVGDTSAKIWTEAFVLSATQDERDGLSSYDVDGSGVTFGVDTGNLHENLTLGTAFSYGGTDLDSTNLTAETQTYQASFYSAYHFDNDYYFTGIFSYALTDFAHNRSNIGGTDFISDAHHDAEQISISSSFGKNIMLDRDILLQPSFQVDYSVVEFESYNEQNAEGLGLNVQQSSINSFLVGPYLRIAVKEELENDVTIYPEIGLGYSYDFIQDKTDTVSTFQAFDSDAPEFSTKGFDPQVHRIDLDLAMSIEYEKFIGKIGYNFDYQEDLRGHIGTVSLSYHF